MKNKNKNNKVDLVLRAVAKKLIHSGERLAAPAGATKRDQIKFSNQLKWT